MAIKFWNIAKANAELDAADSVVLPALSKAGVTSATNPDGSTVGLDKATLAQKISALLAVCQPGENQQAAADLIVTNASLAARIEKVEADLEVAEATVAGLQAEKSALSTRAETAEASVQSLTATQAQKEVELQAAIKENSRLTGEANKFNTELSKVCIAARCIEVPQDGNDSARLEAAQAIPWTEKLAAYQGAVHSAVAKLGVSVSGVPSNAPLKLADAGVLAKLESISDPRERAEYFKANEKAILAARRSLQAS